MSEHDPLTGLPNRRVLFRELEKAMEAKRPFALCYMDLDDFKQVNDTYGHDCGDQLLNGFAERLQSALSTAGTLIRLGGDEFIAILYGVSGALPESGSAVCWKPSEANPTILKA